MPNLPRVVAASPLSEKSTAAISAVAELVTIPPGDQAKVKSALLGAEGFIAGATFPLPGAVLDAAPRLRVVANIGVGYNNIDVDDATERGIAVCNTPGVLTESVVVTTMMLILSASRRYDENHAYVKNGDWAARKPLPPMGFDIEGKTLGVVGYGRIGSAVAQRARAFGMKVIYYDIARPNEDLPHVPFTPFRVLLRQSDIVTLHVNLTPKSRHMMSTEQFAEMKNTAWLVNTSRGPVVDQPALAEALKKGEIAGAALDVLEDEPPDADDRIFSAPNTIILPHLGTATVETRVAMQDLAVRNLVNVIARQAPEECVNREVLTKNGAFRL